MPSGGSVSSVRAGGRSRGSLQIGDGRGPRLRVVGRPHLAAVGGADVPAVRRLEPGWRDVARVEVAGPHLERREELVELCDPLRRGRYRAGLDEQVEVAARDPKVPPREPVVSGIVVAAVGRAELVHADGRRRITRVDALEPRHRDGVGCGLVLIDVDGEVVDPEPTGGRAPAERDGGRLDRAPGQARMPPPGDDDRDPVALEGPLRGRRLGRLHSAAAAAAKQQQEGKERESPRRGHDLSTEAQRPRVRWRARRCKIVPPAWRGRPSPSARYVASSYCRSTSFRLSRRSCASCR